MHWYPLDTWIVVVGMASAASCALLGNFLVLRRMSMMGDAISHAILPGLAAAFFLTGTRASFSMFIGAAVVGVLTAVLTEWIHTFGRVESGAAMGVVFTTLFAIGLILIVRAADHVDLDPGCVLYGAIELTPLDRIAVSLGSLFRVRLPRALVVMGAVFLLNVAVVAALFKELKITSFDPALATTVGINARFFHYLLMTLVAITTVAAFEAVGSILVIAMLIVPAATARLLTDRFGVMLLLSVVVGTAAAGLGHLAALVVPGWFGFDGTSTAGMMAAVLGVVFLLVMLVAPRHGVVSKLVHQAGLSLHIAGEDLLGLLYRADEVRAAGHGLQPLRLLTEARGHSPWQSRIALLSLRMKGQVEMSPEGCRLTEQGAQAAAGLVRANRLWESCLETFMGLGPDRVHEAAHRLEHLDADQLGAELASATGNPQTDPHGRSIPEETRTTSPET